MNLEAVEQGKTPDEWQCYVPIAVLLAAMFGFQKLTSMPSAYAVACAMLLAIVAGCVLFRDKLNIQSAVNDGAAGGLGALIATSSIMGFGAMPHASGMVVCNQIAKTSQRIHISMCLSPVQSCRSAVPSWLV